MRESEFITEIERLARDEYTGGRSSLYQSPEYVSLVDTKPLPGTSGYVYSIEGKRYRSVIRIYNPQDKTVIGALKLNEVPAGEFPIQPTYQVHSITVDEAYRGKDIAKSLYGIALSIMHITLLAGEGQTPGGRQMWISLNKIPGVEVMGYMTIDDTYFNEMPKGSSAASIAAMPEKERTTRSQNVEKLQDIVMSLGGEYLGVITKSRYGGTQHVFTFPVTVGKSELINAIKSSPVGVYTGEYGSRGGWDTGLLAEWTGG